MKQIILLSLLLLTFSSCKKEEQEDPEFCQCGEVTSLNQDLNQISVKNNCTNHVYTMQLTRDEFMTGNSGGIYKVGDSWCTKLKW